MAAHLLGQRVQPAPLDERHRRQATGAGRAARQASRLVVATASASGADVGRPHLLHHAGTELARQRQRDGPAAGPGVDQRQAPRPPRAQAPGLAQGHLHHLFGLRSRNQDPGVDTQVEAAEGPVAEDVLQRLPRRPAVRHGPRRRHGAGRSPWWLAVHRLGHHEPRRR